jgi:hypothetical protein
MPTMTAPAPRVNRKPARPTHGTCRLTLHINGVAYALRRIPTDASAALRCWRLRKADGTTYNAAVTEHGPVCDCPDFVMRREGIDPRGCKHIKALVASGLMAAE